MCQASRGHLCQKPHLFQAHVKSYLYGPGLTLSPPNPCSNTRKSDSAVFPYSVCQASLIPAWLSPLWVRRLLSLTLFSVLCVLKSLLTCAGVGSLPSPLLGACVSFPPWALCLSLILGGFRHCLIMYFIFSIHYFFPTYSPTQGVFLHQFLSSISLSFIILIILFSMLSMVMACSYLGLPVCSLIPGLVNRLWTWTCGFELGSAS